MIPFSSRLCRVCPQRASVVDRTRPHRTRGGRALPAAPVDASAGVTPTRRGSRPHDHQQKRPGRCWNQRPGMTRKDLLMETNGTRLDELDQIIDGFTAVRAFLEEHPTLPAVSGVFMSTVTLWLHSSDFDDDEACRAEFARCARILMAGAPVGTVTKDGSTYAQSVARTFGAATLKVCATRSAVCERRVIGVEKVRVPDPNAPTIEVEREIVEWECAPILGASDAQVAHYAALDAALEDQKAVSA